MIFKNKKLNSVTTLSKLDNRHHSFNIGKKKGNNQWEFLFDEVRNKFKSRQSKPINYKFCNLFFTNGILYVINISFTEL